MIKVITKYFTFLFLLFSLNSCSTISDTIDLAGIVDKTENFLFGNEEEEKQEEDLESNNSVSNEVELEEDKLDIDDIPTERPEFSEIEKDFFEGEKGLLVEVEDADDTSDADDSVKEVRLEQNTALASEQKNIEVISKISQNVRMRVKRLLLNSDPPTTNDGNILSYQNEKDKKPLSYKNDDKIAVFFFPNNSIVPDSKAENVVKEIVKFYGESPLILVGHASSLGGESPQGKKINMELSFARAEAIKNMLINKGFPSDNITVLGKGDLEPSAEPNSNNADSDDRRVEVFLSSN